MTLTPTENYRYSFKKGMTGWDVETIQIAINAAGFSANLVEDGEFGPKTDAAAKVLQGRLNVTVDGVVGPQTQSALCARESNHAELHITPKGLIKGICFGESGGIIPTTSPLYPNKTRDYGPFQDNLLAPSQQALKEAFSPPIQAKSVALDRRSKYEFYRRQPEGDTAEKAWRLAVLSYNWPAAANQIAAGHGDTWTYVEEGTGAKRKLADPAPWIEAYHVAGVRTGWDWCKFYIDSKVVYVTSWSVS